MRLTGCLPDSRNSAISQKAVPSHLADAADGSALLSHRKWGEGESRDKSLIYEHEKAQ